MIFGWCLLRIIHLIVSLQLHYPHSRILITKYNYSDACRRMAHSASAAAQTIAVFAGLTFIALRLTFGESPNPPSWTLFSEMLTDLANEITQCDEWEPSHLHSPAQPVTPAPVRLPDSMPIALASQLDVVPPPAPRGRIDGLSMTSSTSSLIQKRTALAYRTSYRLLSTQLADHTPDTMSSPFLADHFYPTRNSLLKAPPQRSKSFLAGYSTVDVC
jgi:hypothetical protein